MDANSDRFQSISTLRGMIEDIGVAMLTTKAADGALHSRPMVALDAEPDGTLWFLTRQDTTKAIQIAGHRRVNLAYAAPDRQQYLSVSGRAAVVRDASRAERLWRPACREWLPEGPDDPNLVLVCVEVEDAAYWDPRSSRMQRFAGFDDQATVAPRATGQPEQVTLDTSGN